MAPIKQQQSQHVNQEGIVDIEEEKIVIPTPDKDKFEKLPKDIQELYNHRAKYQINDNGSVTFYPTPNCKQTTTTLQTNKIAMYLKKTTYFKKLHCIHLLSYSDPDTQIIKQSGIPVCSFITASLTAWSSHFPFRFRAQHIWLLILQAVAVHVDQNAEKLRNKYVKHDDKKELKIEIPAFPSGEDWQKAIKGFALQIDENTIEDTCQLFECDFSGSTLTEQIATKITIMDVCKNFFEYRCCTECGFPAVTLDGTKDDWIKLKKKTMKLLNEKVDKKFGDEWGKALLPLLDRFIVAFDGDIDCVFWNSMIKTGATWGSGSWSWFSGWFNILFPFIQNKFNRFCVPYSMELDYVTSGESNDDGSGNDKSHYPLGIGSAPVVWDRDGQIIKLKFISGFFGATQDPETLEICPNIGWGVANAMNADERK